MIEKFILLIIGHALCDYALQTEAMAKFKSYKVSTKDMPGMPNWVYWLTAHSLIHGGMIYIITGSMFFCIFEIIVHWFIDLSKCGNKINAHVDQTLHILCKALYL